MCVQNIQAETNIQLILVCFPLFAGLPSFNCLEEVLCPECCFRVIFYSWNLPYLFKIFFPSVLSGRNKENLGGFLGRVIFWSGKFISNFKFQRLKTAAKNISCLDCHRKKELFVVFFMLLFKAVKLLCNKL